MGNDLITAYVVDQRDYADIRFTKIIGGKKLFNEIQVNDSLAAEAHLIGYDVDVNTITINKKSNLEKELKKLGKNLKEII